MVRRIFRLDLAQRFITSLREEGLRPALRKARIYTSLRLRGMAPSILGGGGAPGYHEPQHHLLGLWADVARGGGFHVTRDLSRGPRIALIGDLNLPQCRKYRVEQLAAFWQAQGVPCDYVHYQDIPRAVQLLQQATHVMEYRLTSTPLTEMYRYEARRLGLPVLWDIDDPLFSISAYETYANMDALDPKFKDHFRAEAPKYASMMNGADIVTVSTPGLAEHARLYTRRPVHVRRNFADEACLSDGAAAMARAEKDETTFRVVFASGSQGHEADFSLIADQLTGFITADPARRLVILGHFKMDSLPDALRAQTEQQAFVPYAQYLTLLAQADVAVMPLQDDLFNRCKSGVRVIDAASVGVPSLVGTVGDLPALIKDGETGIIAQTPEDWTAALDRLAGDRAACAAMGQAARRDLEEHWTGQPAPQIIAPEVLEWLRQ